ncbi:Syntaxin-52 [Striga hermonthica]|uniref:Syntaxin-52 n=1 Tax=Striga hermonthica TaxID=68872 RepID=A0A9N7NFS2_STRHE|nr:Syntaxin-52 [Striga hermonthica]
MAASGDSWVREYNEAIKLADDITNMITERNSLPASGPEAQRYASAIRRKITILGTRLDNLQSFLSKLPVKQSLSEKEMNRRRDMVACLRSKVNQMASTLNMSNSANRDSLLGPEMKPVDAMSRISGLDNHGVVGLQRQVMKEQDEGLEKLEETVSSTKHIALAVNEELDLHTRLIDNLDEHVDVTDSRLQQVQRRLARLNKRTKGGCSCLHLLLSVIENSITGQTDNKKTQGRETTESMKTSEANYVKLGLHPRPAVASNDTRKNLEPNCDKAWVSSLLIGSSQPPGFSRSIMTPITQIPNLLGHGDWVRDGTGDSDTTKPTSRRRKEVAGDNKRCSSRRAGCDGHQDELNQMIAEDVAARFVQPQVSSAVNLIVPTRREKVKFPSTQP